MAGRRSLSGWVILLIALALSVGSPSLSKSALAVQTDAETPTEVVVTGIGSATAPAAAAEFQVLFMSYDGTPIALEDLEPFVAVIVDSGVPEQDVVVSRSVSQMGPFGPNSGEIRFEIADPDADELQGLAEALFEASAATGTSFQIGHIGVRYLAEDCDALLQSAMEAAVADAWIRGERLASPLGGSLGSLIKAEDSPYYGGSASSSCAAEIPGYAGGMYGPGVLDPFTATAPVEATAYATIMATFLIESSGGATPEAD